jgi:hypothetical protein
MAGPSEASRSVPTSEPNSLRRAARRTLVLRAALALALVAGLALVLLVAWRQDVRHAPLVPSGKAGMLVLDLSASVYEGAFGQTIQKLANDDQRVGVVAFSDAAYELVPPGTPAKELLPLLRYFGVTSVGGIAAHNPWEQFRAGTKISEGLRVAEDVLLREGISNGSIVLVSDLEILPDEINRLANVVARLRQEGIEVRIVPLFPTPEKTARIEAILGGSAVLRETSESAPVRAPEARSFGAVAPWTFVVAGALLVALLAVNEGFLTRLEIRR